MTAVLVTGGSGFVGTNTVERLLRTGQRVRIIDDLSRPGVERNLHWLERRHGSKLEVEIADVRNRESIRRAMRGVSRVFHFAAQVAVTTSIEDPVADAATNLQGTLNLLEEARARPRPPAILFTSTNKVYGSLEDVPLRENGVRYEPADASVRARGISENRPLSFCTPYGCSKGAADQYVLDWAGSYRVPTVVFRMSCIYGPHQFGTEDQGWVAHFLIRAIEGAPITLYGDGKQVRDVLYIDDLIEALLLACGKATDLAGQAFNIGGGANNAISLLELLDQIAVLRGEQPEVLKCGWRQGDQRYYVSDTTRFQRLTGWRAAVTPPQGLALLDAWLSSERTQSRLAA